MGKEPGEIRQEIEQDREEMGETVGALTYKADVPGRMRDSVAERRGRLKTAISGTRDRVRRQMASKSSMASERMGGAGQRISSATPDREEVKQSAQQAVGIAQENPLGLAFGGVALGFLAGLALPSTTTEDERLGPISEQVTEQAKETGQEALERGQHVAKEAAQSASETAREVGQGQVDDLRASAQDRAQDVQETAREQRS